ncbi:MAG: L-rhamnose/proton symporter RhaT [Candidatus Latescibacterota bacterium]
MSPLFIGLFIVITAGLFQGSFAMPMSYARSWKFENSWMMFSLLGMVGLNLLVSLLTIPGLFAIIGAATFGELAPAIFFGILWGLGAITFGLGVSSVGLALGYATVLGTVLGMGTFVPMVVLHPSEILSAKGILILLGLLVTFTGIGVSGAAGIRKEREQGKAAGEITRNARFSMKMGILICLISGICSSSINIGFSLSHPLIERALSMGAPENWAGNVIWVVLFISGGILNIIYCSYLLIRNNSTKEYNNPGSWKNLGWMALMSAFWIGSFIAYGAGSTMMGAWGTVIGWSVYMALSIAIANFWGILQGEWVGASRKTRLLMIRGIGIIILAIVIFAYSGTI